MRTWIGLLVVIVALIAAYSLFRDSATPPSKSPSTRDEPTPSERESTQPSLSPPPSSLGSEGSPRTSATADPSGKTSAPDLPRAVGARIEGRVIDRSGRPIGGATIRLLGSDGALLRVDRDLGFSTPSDSDGRFVFADPPAMLGLSVEASANGLASLRRDIGLLDVDQIVGPIELILEPEILLRGTVRDPEGRVLPKVKLEVSIADPGPGVLATPVAIATTDDSGRYQVGGLRRLLYRVLASKEGFVPQSLEKTLFAVTLRPESTLDITLEPATGNVNGRVLDAADVPIAGATVTAIAEPHIVHATTSSSGEFALSGLGRGAYRATAEAPGLHPAPPEVVRAGQREVILRVARGASVRGRVTKSGGAALTSAAVDLLARSSDSGSFLLVKRATFENGAFHSEGLAPGVYRLVVTSLEARRTESAPFELASGQDLDLGAIECVRGGVVTGRISGSGDAAEGTLALLLGDIDAANPAARGAALFAAETAKTRYRSGESFRLENIAPGDYSLLILPTKGAPRTLRGVRVADDQTTTIEDHSIAVGGQVFGRILDVQGASVIAATVRATHEDGSIRTTTSDSDGYFTFTDLPSGQVTIALDPTPEIRGAARPVTIAVDPSGSKEIELRVRPEGT